MDKSQYVNLSSSLPLCVLPCLFSIRALNYVTNVNRLGATRKISIVCINRCFSICYSRPLVLLLPALRLLVAAVAATVANVVAAVITIYVILQTIFGCWNAFFSFIRTRDTRREHTRRRWTRETQYAGLLLSVHQTATVCAWMLRVIDCLCAVLVQQQHLRLPQLIELRWSSDDTQTHVNTCTWSAFCSGKESTFQSQSTDRLANKNQQLTERIEPHLIALKNQNRFVCRLLARVWVWVCEYVLI